MPRFSIITITKDNPNGFAVTEESVKSQRFTDYEWIIIDGAVEPDRGIYDAMNKGIERAQGDYLIFMNAGDCFASDLTLQIIAAAGDADFIYGDAWDGGYLKPARSHARLHRGLFTHHQAMVYRRAVLDDLRYDETYPIAADYKFTAQFLQKAQSILYIPQPLCIFETGGISQYRARQGRTEQRKIRRELGIVAPMTPAWQWVAQTIRNTLPSVYGWVRARKVGLAAKI